VEVLSFSARRWALALLLASAGCGRAPAPVAPACERLVTLAPNLTETAFALGLGERVVGVDDYSQFPEAAAALPKLGGLFNPAFEALVALRPDLVLLLPSHRDLEARLAALGVSYLVVPNETLADIEASFTAIAERCGVAAEGRRRAEEFRAALAPRPVAAGRRVLISIARPEGLDEIVAAGPRTFLDELLARLGAVNVLADSPTSWPPISLEEIVARSPETIFEIQSHEVSEAERRALIAAWDELPTVDAVRSARVVVVGADYALVPGPRLGLLYRDLAAALD
jgi:iron complex transport system substrate-binding protein